MFSKSPCPDDAFLLSVAGVFDERAVVALLAALANLPDSRPVCIDLSRVEISSDAALGSLISHVATRTGSVRLHGLGRHQALIARYLVATPDRTVEDALSPVSIA